MCGHRAELGNYASARSADPAVGTPPIPEDGPLLPAEELVDETNLLKRSFQ